MGTRLEGKVAIITGATLGLGKAAALLFAGEGASVAICDRGRTPENAQKTLDAAAGLPGEIAYKKCDVMNKDDIAALVKFTRERFGGIDVMVNNAIIDNPGGMLEDVTLEDWEDGLFCHLTAPLLFCKLVVPLMIEQGGGSIINVSSGNAMFGSPSISSYGPAKAGMINFTKSLAVTYGPHGIRANALTPARMLTEKKLDMLEGNPAEVRRQKFLYPRGNPAQPEEVAEVMLFLASDESSAVTGHSLVADCGASAFNPLSIPGRRNGISGRSWKRKARSGCMERSKTKEKSMNFWQKITLILLLTIVLSNVAYAQLVHIPDPYLRAVIRETLNLPDDTPITQASILHLERLDARGMEITNLTGIEFATNLEYLELARNPISDLTPVANLTKLHTLFVWHCEITDISPLTNLTELTHLDLSYNHIDDITALAGMTEMIEMRLVNNNIRDVTPLANLTKLVHLELQYNRITDVTPLENLTNLEHINTENNPIFDPDSPLVDIADLNLRAAIYDALHRQEHLPINQAAMLDLETLDARDSEIHDLTGLEFAKNLVYLQIASNPISDLTPLANLTKLTHLFASGCDITDINPLASLTTLQYLTLTHNHIVNVSPLAGMTRLRELILPFNEILDVSSLANLTNLEILDLTHNRIGDHTPLDGLSLRDFRYDQTCDVLPLPLKPRLDNRTYPSIFAAWGGPSWRRTLNRPDLSGVESIASHDLWFSVPQFGINFVETSHGFKIMGNVDEAIRRRDEFHAINPNMVFLVDIRMFEYWDDEAPEDWHGWVRDAEGNRVSYWPNAYMVDFTKPAVQDRIVEQVLAVANCGLYDGIFFDHWHDRGSKLKHYVGLEAEQRARDTIIQRIRAETRSDFLVMGNTNVHPMPRTGTLMNGSFMETPVPGDLGEDGALYWLGRAEESLKWLEQNLREPRTNAVEGETIPTEPHDSPDNLRWMRAITTLSLTYSDGYVLFSKFPGHHHFWYEFWDADLGKPVGPKSQLYEENISGLYIREFTNGWAVHNHSGETQEITLPELVTGVASETKGTTHTLPNLDGEMYLRVKPLNPADVNGDGAVNILDLTLVAQAFGKDGLQGDVNGDGVVNVFDLVFVAGEMQ